ncbi:MAG: DUF2169 domain-containing protein [Myxococcales bacterium]|nr:DUF2169 domain-containing protein [Myxococcales bacterium]
MRVVNDTEGRVIGLPIKDVGGRELLAVVLKYTFALDSDGTATIVPAEESPPIDLIDTYNGDDPALASIRRPSQLCEFKPGTEVLLLGSAAVPPNDATSTEVGLVVGSIKKTVRVFGLRTWRMGSFGGVAPGPALPIREPVPLIYELSWGGRDLRDPARPLGEPRNYSGRGINRSPRELVDSRRRDWSCRPAQTIPRPSGPSTDTGNHARHGLAPTIRPGRQSGCPFFHETLTQCSTWPHPQTNGRRRRCAATSHFVWSAWLSVRGLCSYPASTPGSSRLSMACGRSAEATWTAFSSTPKLEPSSCSGA